MIHMNGYQLFILVLNKLVTKILIIPDGLSKIYRVVLTYGETIESNKR